MITIGFAIKLDGAINVKTVSPTEQAAKINWLAAELGMPIYNRTPDREIEAMWGHFSEKHGARCIKVQILEMVP